MLCSWIAKVTWSEMESKRALTAVRLLQMELDMTASII